MLVRTCGSSKPCIICYVYKKISLIGKKLPYKTGKYDFIADYRSEAAKWGLSYSILFTFRIVPNTDNKFVDKKKNLLKGNIFSKRY